MNKVTIRDINSTNLAEVRKINLHKHQTSFIDSVDECLEEAKLYKEWCPAAIFADDVLVGFAMYGAFGKNPDTWIDRIMIDAKNQGKGFGKKAMEELIDIVTKKYNVNIVYLSFVEENVVAQKMYEKLGFKFINEYDPEGELIYKFELAAEESN